MIDSRLTRLRPLLAAGLVFVAAGCSDLFGVNEGKVRFVLSSEGGIVAADPAASPSQDGAVLDGNHNEGRPRHFFRAANVTFSSLLARNLDGVLVNVVLAELPVDVDLVTLDNGREVSLPEASLDPGSYDQLVVVMTKVVGVTLDGTTVTLEPPGGGWTAIIPVCPFEVADGATTPVGLQFQFNQSFSWQGSRYHFQPRFVCETPEAPPAS